MNVRDLFGIVVSAIGLWLFVHGILLLSQFLLSVLVVALQGGGSALSAHSLIQNLTDPIVYMGIGAILLFGADGFVTTIYGQQAS